MPINYSLRKIKDLQDIAKERGLKRFYRLKKENLVEVLTGEKKVTDFKNVRGTGQDLSKQTINGLLDIAKERGVKGCSKFSKKDLLAVLKGEKNVTDISRIKGTDDLSRQTIIGLRDIAKKKGLTGYSTLNKGELLAVLSGQRELVNEVRVKPDRKRTLKDLKKTANGRGLKGYSTLTKDQLNRVLSGEIKIKDISHIKEKNLDFDHLWKNDLTKETKRGLREIARKEGYRGCSRLSKEDLIDRLQNSDKGPLKVSQLRKMAKANGLTNYRRANKKELLNGFIEYFSWDIKKIELWRTAFNEQIRIYKGFCPPWNGLVQSDCNLPQQSIFVMSLFLDSIEEKVIEIF